MIRKVKRTSLTLFTVDSDLVAKRRLGQTTLKAKPGLVGSTNATKLEHLGSFEYAHLKVSLPDNLAGSDMFSTPYPEAYFLMVRLAYSILEEAQRKTNDNPLK